MNFKKRLAAALLVISAFFALTAAPAQAAIEWWPTVYHNGVTTSFNEGKYKARVVPYWRNGFNPRNDNNVGRAAVKMHYVWWRADGEDMDCPDGNYFEFETRVYDYDGHYIKYSPVNVDCDESGWNERIVRYGRGDQIRLNYVDGTPVMKTRIQWHNTFFDDEVSVVGQKLWYMNLGATRTQEVGP